MGTDDGTVLVDGAADPTRMGAEDGVAEGSLLSVGANEGALLMDGASEGEFVPSSLMTGVSWFSRSGSAHSSSRVLHRKSPITLFGGRDSQQPTHKHEFSPIVELAPAK